MQAVEMQAVAIITILALAQYIFFAIQVGSMRGKHGVKAPAVAGHPEFERMFRVQQNTMEQLVAFIPALWLYAFLVNPMWGAGIGLVFIIGRFLYRAEYLKDPDSRGPGFALTFIPTAVLLVWSLIDAVLSFF